jgi:hypothetical protein
MTQELTPEQETVLLIRGTISTFSQGKQAEVYAAYDAIRKLAEQYGQDATSTAVLLLGAELAARG